MTETKNNQKSDLLTMLAVILWTITAFAGAVALKGAFRKRTWTKAKLIGWMIFSVWLSLIIYSPYGNIPTLLDLLEPRFVSPGFGNWVYQHLNRGWQIVILFGVPFCIWLFFEGIFDWIRNAKFQTALNHLGLKTSTGLTPKVTRVIELENYQKIIQVQAIGIDVASFRERKGALEASFNAIVQSIDVQKSNRQRIEILISDRELPTLIRFNEVSEKLVKPYSFLVGQSFNNFLIADLCDIHHLLIAGATGGGKSVFYKQVLVGILKSSSFVQLYLIDLKR